jgi:hypothetical protein
MHVAMDNFCQLYLWLLFVVFYCKIIVDKRYSIVSCVCVCVCVCVCACCHFKGSGIVWQMVLNDLSMAVGRKYSFEVYFGVALYLVFWLEVKIMQCTTLFWPHSVHRLHHCKASDPCAMVVSILMLFRLMIRHVF